MSESISVLVISHDVVGSKMAGPGIRYWALARVLSQHFQVTLAIPNESELSSENVRLWPYEFGRWETLAPVVERAKAILLCGDVLVSFPELQEAESALIVDGYDPHTLETLAMFAGTPEQERRHRDRERILQMQCRVGDFFLCASERQRDWWLGLLEATGRVNVHTYNADPALRQLIDVVPFGLPPSPPRHTKRVLKGGWPGIEPEDKVVLWGGGLWQWLDPLTAIRAMARIREQRDDVRLVFPGTRHPNPSVAAMPVVERAVELAEELRLLDTQVFFGEWVPYEDWPNYLLEADVGLSLHFDTLETRLSFRTRGLDYIWAGLPLVVTRGDTISDIVSRFELGAVIDYEDEDALAGALLHALACSSEMAQRFARARSNLTWERVAEPLVAFCREPHRAPDRDSGITGAWISETQQVETLHRAIGEKDAEIVRLRELVAGYESGRFMRLMRWLRGRGLWRENL